MVKNVQKNLDLSKASDPARIAVVVLKNCEPQLSYILAGLFNMSERILFSGLLECLIGGPFI